jgi:LPXTG-site transpeptidase (sortase) family protein
MIRSRFTNFFTAVGLVMIYFFIDGLSVNMELAYLGIRGKEDYHPVEAHEILPLKVIESNLETDQIEGRLVSPEKVEEAVESGTPSGQIESQAFYAPSQEVRPNLLSPVGERILLSEIPLRLVIPAIDLDAPILGVQPEVVNIDGTDFLQWLSPNEFAAGWHESSARLGDVGNTVLNGHHNISGEVFRRLIELVEGDLIQVFSDQHLFVYQITNKMILPEKYEVLEVRVKNAQWILPSQDERLTLITCWPYESNTHRLIIVARPVSVDTIPDIDQELLPRIFDGNNSLNDGR